MTRIVLRLPADLPNAPATSATADDWTTIQKNGESFVRPISPTDAVPPLDAAKITTGEFILARIPQLSSVESETGAQRSLTVNWLTCVQAAINVAAGDLVIVAAEVELLATRPSGGTAFGAVAQILRGGSPVLENLYASYLSGASGAMDLGGARTAILPQSGLAPGSYTYQIQCRVVGSAISGVFTKGRLSLVKLSR